MFESDWCIFKSRHGFKFFSLLGLITINIWYFTKFQNQWPRLGKVLTICFPTYLGFTYILDQIIFHLFLSF
jgi:hypothetical protein